MCTAQTRQPTVARPSGPSASTRPRSGAFRRRCRVRRQEWQEVFPGHTRTTRTQQSRGHRVSARPTDPTTPYLQWTHQPVPTSSLSSRQRATQHGLRQLRRARSPTTPPDVTVEHDHGTPERDFGTHRRPSRRCGVGTARPHVKAGKGWRPSPGEPADASWGAIGTAREARAYLSGEPWVATHHTLSST